MAGELPPFAVEPEVVAVLERLWQRGHAAYLVGGGVRDALLGRPGTDWDVATDARPERILQVFPGGTYENRFGTVKARGLEITTFRRDHRYADHRRPDSVTFSDDIYEDLARRDLTINAIAWGRRGDAPPRIIDPADGQDDLRAGLVRAVGDPARRFDEDALRLLRAVRIAARLGFTIEPVTRAALVAHAADVGWVSEERVGSEVRRMLDIAQPSAAFRLMHETGLLATTLPELEEILRRAGPAVGEAAFGRTLEVLDAASATAPRAERLLWAALLAETRVEDARAALERLRVAGRDRDAICLLIERAAVETPADWSDADVRRFMGSLPAELLDDLLALRQIRANVAGTGAAHREAGFQARVLSQRRAGSALVLGELAIDGRDLQQTLGVPEGRTIGLILERLLSDVLEDPALNRRTTLLTRAGLILDELLQGAPGRPDHLHME